MVTNRPMREPLYRYESLSGGYVVAGYRCKVYGAVCRTSRGCGSHLTRKHGLRDSQRALALEIQGGAA